METKDTYNGWKNRETWLYVLWVDNDGGSSYWEERAQEIYNDTEASQYLTREEETARTLGEELKASIEEQIEGTTGVTGFLADLINTAKDEIDFDEVAEHYMGEIEKEVAHEN